MTPRNRKQLQHGREGKKAEEKPLRRVKAGDGKELALGAKKRDGGKGARIGEPLQDGARPLNVRKLIKAIYVLCDALDVPVSDKNAVGFAELLVNVPKGKREQILELVRERIRESVADEAMAELGPASRPIPGCSVRNPTPTLETYDKSVSANPAGRRSVSLAPLNGEGEEALDRQDDE